MRIIAFVGAPASGKTEAASVARELGIPVISMGDVIRAELKRRGLPLTDENAGKMGNELRRKEGMDAVARRCVPLIKAANADIVVVEGVRGIAEVEAFKKEFGGDFLLVRVEASFPTRYERIRRRGRGDDALRPEEFKRREEREMGWGMAEAMKIADIVVENEGSLEEFRERIKELLGNLMRS
ncbi:MAG: Dephospho-CoA kinase [Candidatus Alkanophagales archaeon MCA70_species_2]|nr:Dephospho-CoA kinase [Candidatus Alkanophaga liquidiphilum]RLG37251.1 MAG: dephospho-CoA kinase [Candidatus Alkanophagales archaeon]